MTDTIRNLTGTICQLLKSNLNVILTGAPGTGKTFTAKEVAKAMVGAIVPEDATEEEKEAAKTAEEERIQSVQFHPGYEYSDFVIGLKPTSDRGSVSFNWKDGVFKAFADKAMTDLNRNYVFIIDEINRADLSRAFGEVFSLLEKDFRYPENVKGVTLPNGERFVIPENLYIIGTMNDIDPSGKRMDFTFRRRFAWLEVTAKDSERILDSWAKKEKVDSAIVGKLKCAMGALNNRIREDKHLKLGPAYELGGAYFTKFGDGETKDVKESYERLWKNHLRFVLSEYLCDNPKREPLLDGLHRVYIKGCETRC